MKAIIETNEPAIRPVAGTRSTDVVAAPAPRRMTNFYANASGPVLFHAWRP